MAIVTGIFTVGASVTLVTAHTLGVKSFSAQGYALGIRLVFFSERTGGNIIVTAQTCFFTGKILLMFSPEFSIESNRMTASARNRSFLTDVIMVAIRAFIAILI